MRPDIAQQLRSVIAARSAVFEDLLVRLVDVSSHTHDPDGVNAAQALLAEHIALDVTKHGGGTFGDHYVYHARRPCRDGGIALVGHMDTVFPAERFARCQVDGRIARGPGVHDMKGGLVIVAMALDALARIGVLPDASLSVFVVGDEEVGSPDSAPLLREQVRGATAALVFESGREGDRIVTRRKGSGLVEATAAGRAAHAGNAHADGANAIWALARFVDRAQSLTDYSTGCTINVGLIRGGTSKNTVPDRAEAEVDLRFCTRSDGVALRARLFDAARQASDSVPGTAITLRELAARNPLERTEASDKLRDEYLQCQRDAGLGGGEMPLVGGGSDAATTADAGVPSIDGLGIRGEGFHTLEERADLDSMVPKALALALFVAQRAVR